MKITSEKSSLKGEVQIPASKSHTIRAVAISTLAKGKSIIRHPLLSSDALAAMGAGRAFGAKIEAGETWEVEGVAGAPRVPDNVVDTHNSGTTTNFFMGVASLTEGTTVLTGDEQIVRRPVQPLLEALNQLGASVRSTRNNGLPPVIVTGRLKGGRARLRGISSQYVSSLLVNCPLIEKDSEIEVFDVAETPYIEMTKAWLNRQGIRYEASDDYTHFKIFGGQSYKAQDVSVPADFSSATFFLVAGAILDADITLLGLDMNDAQGDKQIVHFLKDMGARIDFVDNGGIRVRGGALKGMELDLGNTPDALPAMAVLACFAGGKTALRNVAHARLKETDRISVMTRELTRLGARVEELPDGMIIHESKLKGCPVKGYADHRVVMALTVAGMAIPGKTTVDTAEAVSVTFPNFIELVQNLGGKVKKTK
jgi:3-phosphoshikimate 1-carboxyvinyltransferase